MPAPIAESFRINLRETCSRELLLAKYLQIQKQGGVEIKSLILEPVMAFLELYAVGEDRAVSKSELERVLVEAMISLSGQMSSLANYARTRHQIELSPESWQMFGVLPSPLQSFSERSLAFVNRKDDKLETFATEPALGTDTRWLEQSVDDVMNLLEDSEPPTVSVSNCQLNVNVESEAVTFDNNDFDDDDDLTDEEYLAKTASQVRVGTISVKD
ncbi:MAG: hypothetical protein HC778_02975 [Chamaesiphon sp. CSU_1_12]|nr:hypothetical protein [Chamaesiphon sp. CSU_1_12]